jgi:endoglucanase Acf2
MTVGSATVSTELLPGEHGPSNRLGDAALPKVTPDFKGPVATNDWWSSLIWEFDDDPYSRPMFPHPLAVKADASGLGVGYPTAPVVTDRDYRFPYQSDLHVGVAGLHAPDARVQSWSDWAVTAAWTDTARSLAVTMGHGLPFVYARVKGGEARIETSESPALPLKVWSDHDGVLGVTLRGHHYGVFAPTGATWKHDGGAFVSNLANKGFFSVALLPDDAAATLELFRKHAYAFVTKTEASWAVDSAASQLKEHFEVTTELVEPGPDRVNEPLLALYPHQWKSTKAPFEASSYISPRGQMRVLAARSFDVHRDVHGVLPSLPDLSTDEQSDIRGLVRTVSKSSNLFPIGLDGKKDTYWAGKSLGRVSNLAWMAHQLGDDDTTKRLVKALEGELSDWFDGEPPNRFYYDKQWRTLIGLPAGYQSNTELNDHHFHYGYFVWAAATVAAFDPAFDVKAKWGGMIELLVKDVANWDAADERFPRLRYFDPYAGHSWASGPAMFDRGNNEESSSEDMNFASGVTLWGVVTHTQVMQDLGTYLYESTASAIENYWLDVDHDVFPKSYRHPVAGIVWGDGANFGTWWDPNPIYVHGINMLPWTGASLYLGRHPDDVRAKYAALVDANRGPVHQWRDILWMYLALANPDQAASAIRDDHYFDPEFGNSWGAVEYWVSNLRALGQVDASVLANTASYAVFKRGNARTYVAYNPGDTPLRVKFSDGATLDVAPRSIGHQTQAP